MLLDIQRQLSSPEKLHQIRERLLSVSSILNSTQVKNKHAGPNIALLVGINSIIELGRKSSENLLTKTTEQC